MEKRLEKEFLLRRLYYSPKTGYRNGDHLLELAKKEGPSLEMSKSFVKNWLLKQSSHTRFKNWNKPKHYRHTFVRDFDQLQMDLVFMPEKYKGENEGYSIIITSIDILSRYAFCEPILNREGNTVKKGIEIILKRYVERFGKYPKAIQFDEGSEFLNRVVKSYLENEDIDYFFTISPRKASIVERLNRTLKTITNKMFEANGNHNWKSHFDKIVENYNHSKHRSIGMKPSEVDEENKFVVWRKLFGKKMEIKKPKYEVGDEVRVLHLDVYHRVGQLIYSREYKKNVIKEKDKGKKEIRTFGDFLKEKYKDKEGGEEVLDRHVAQVRKGIPPFSDEIFRIQDVLLGDPNVYKLWSEEANIEVLGIFYEEELSLVR